MNWTDAKTNRLSRGARAAGGRQKRPRVLASFAGPQTHVKEPENNIAPTIGLPPPARRSSSRSSRLSRASRTSNSLPSSPFRHASGRGARTGAEKSRKRPRANSGYTDANLTTVENFFRDDPARDHNTGPISYHPQGHNGKTIDDLRKELLAREDWGLTRAKPTPSSRKRPREAARDTGLSDVQGGGHPAPPLTTGHARSKPRHQRVEPIIHREDVRIRVGSQDKRLGDSSILGETRPAFSTASLKRGPQVEVHRSVGLASYASTSIGA